MVVCSFFLPLPTLFFFATPRGMQYLSSSTRDGTLAPCSGSMESEPLYCQGIPNNSSSLCNNTEILYEAELVLSILCFL